MSPILLLLLSLPTKILSNVFISLIRAPLLTGLLYFFKRLIHVGNKQSGKDYEFVMLFSLSYIRLFGSNYSPQQFEYDDNCINKLPYHIKATIVSLYLEPENWEDFREELNSVYIEVQVGRIRGIRTLSKFSF